MGPFEAFVLGAVQGVTEFLPISSSGHLILAREVLALPVAGGLAFDAVLQLSTALAVLVYFRADFAMLAQSAYCWGTGGGIAKEQRVLLLALALGTLPAVGAGLVLEDAMETAFRSAELVAWMLIAGSALFAAAEYAMRRSPRRELTVGSGVGIGLFQCLALIPGVSRSGATISGGLLFGLPRAEAARFGFLLAFPIIAGSGAKKLAELVGTGALDAGWMPLLVGSATAFLVGLAAIGFLMRFLKTRSLMPFVWYRLALASAVLIFW